MSRLQTNAIRHLGSAVDNLTLDNAGRVLLPNQPAFRACLGATQTYTFSGSKDIALSYCPSNLNRGGHYNPATGLFTAPVSGMYCFQFGAVALSPSGEGFLVLEPLINGALNGLTYSSSAYIKIHESGSNSSTILSLAAGDTVKFNVYSPVTITFGNSDAGHTWPEGRTFMSGFLIG